MDGIQMRANTYICIYTHPCLHNQLFIKQLLNNETQSTLLNKFNELIKKAIELGEAK